MDPPDFIPEDFANIIGNLSEGDLESIINIAQQFSADNESSSTSKEEKEGFSFDPAMIFKMMELIERLNNSQNDPRCKLITALKPLLSPERRKRADTALELIKLLSIFSAE